MRRISQLITEVFPGNMDLWARLYDRNGDWRYAIQLLHVCSDVPGTTDIQFAKAFEDVAAQVQATYHIPIGFMLDIIGDGDRYSYVAAPSRAGSLLEQQPSVLAVNGFASEVFSGKVINGHDALTWTGASAGHTTITLIISSNSLTGNELQWTTGWLQVCL